MNIVQINSVYGTKSTGTIVKDISILLQEYGNTSIVISPQKTEEDTVLNIGNPLDWKIHAVYTRLLGKQGLGSVSATRRLLMQLDKIKPDIIHLHNIHSNFINYKLLLQYTAQKSIPVVLTLHDCWFLTGKCFHFLDIGCTKWESGCKNCPKRFKDIPSVLVDNTKSVYNLKKELYKKNELYIVGCSQWITEIAKKSPLCAQANIRYIYNGVDTEVFSPEKGDLREKLNIDKQNFVIITMANKWFDDVNERIRNKIVDMLEEKDCLIIVGCKEEQLNVQQERKHKARVILLPHINERDELVRVYNTGDVFINLTHIDTLPTVNMEALSCGLPVITYRAGGSGELVDTNVTGYVVNDFADDCAIIKAVKNVKNGCISKQKCREKAVASFNKLLNYKKYLKLYEEIKNN